MELADREIECLFAHVTEFCCIFSAAAVKNNQLVAGPEAQHSTDVTRLLSAEYDVCIRSQ
jgi:hypothetical protein